MSAKGSSPAPQPDPQIGQAAVEQAELGKDWLSFAEEQFDVANERQQSLDDLTQRVGEQQLATQDEAQRWSREDRQRYEDVFQPLEDDFVEQATSWDSPERRDRVAAEARTDVLQNADSQRDSTRREMMSMGIRPDSGRFASMERAGELDTALAAAGAENNARRGVEREGVAMQADAMNVGRGLPSQSASAASLGLNAGQSAVSGATSANQNFRANQSIMGQGYRGAMSGNQQSANMLNQQYQNQLNSWSTNRQAQQQDAQAIGGGIGTIAGAGLGFMAGGPGGAVAGASMMSDENKKTDKKPVEGALVAIKGLPVESWRYTDDAKAGPVEAHLLPPDSRRHVGTYAQDWARETGLGDGETIPVQDAIGLTMKAVQEVDDKLERIAGSRKRPKAEATA